MFYSHTNWCWILGNSLGSSNECRHSIDHRLFDFASISKHFQQEGQIEQRMNFDITLGNVRISSLFTVDHDNGIVHNDSYK